MKRTLLLAALTALAGAAVATATPRSTPPPVAVRGTWTTTFSGDEHFRFGGHQLPSGVPNAGVWELKIGLRTAMFVNNGNGARFPVGPTFRYIKRRFVFGYDPMCPHNYAHVPGTYAYQLTDGVLTFRVIHDSCLDRVATLVAHPWQKAP